MQEAATIGDPGCSSKHLRLLPGSRTALMYASLIYPRCSLPPSHLNGVDEMHPGNYGGSTVVPTLAMLDERQSHSHCTLSRHYVQWECYCLSSNMARVGTTTTTTAVVAWVHLVDSVQVGWRQRAPGTDTVAALSTYAVCLAPEIDTVAALSTYAVSLCSILLVGDIRLVYGTPYP